MPGTPNMPGTGTRGAATTARTRQGSAADDHGEQGPHGHTPGNPVAHLTSRQVRRPLDPRSSSASTTSCLLVKFGRTWHDVRPGVRLRIEFVSRHAGVGDPDHREMVRARCTSMVYQHHRREGSAGVAAGPARRLDPRGGPTPVGLGTSTTPGAGRVRSGWQGLVRRHGGDADEPLVRPASETTVNGAKTADSSSSREAVKTR
jgi:hypothetical protein